MVDVLAERGAEDDALCAVCAGGDSSKEASNEIVFCERCDVAVHQKCYGVDVIPTGELWETCPLSCRSNAGWRLLAALESRKSLQEGFQFGPASLRETSFEASQVQG